jgi:kinesin family protein 12
LLNPGSARKPLAVRWSKKARGFFVENLFTVDCEELDDLIAVLEEGLRNRAVGKHNMNEFSRSTVVTIYA